MRTRGEIAVRLMWAALVGVIVVGVAQGWGETQIVLGAFVVLGVVVALDRWARR